MQITDLKQQSVFLQTVHVKVKSANGKFVSTYALLVIGKLKLKKNRELVNISSIKDTVVAIISTKEFELPVMDNSNGSSLTIKEALAIEKEKFNVPSQLVPPGYKSGKEWELIQGMQLACIDPK